MSLDGRRGDEWRDCSCSASTLEAWKEGMQLGGREGGREGGGREGIISLPNINMYTCTHACTCTSNMYVLYSR